MALFIVVFVILLSVLFFRLPGKASRYSLDHAILNTSPPKTLWMNMGYWKVTRSWSGSQILTEIIGHKVISGGMWGIIQNASTEGRPESGSGCPGYRMWVWRFHGGPRGLPTSVVAGNYIGAITMLIGKKAISTNWVSMRRRCRTRRWSHWPVCRSNYCARLHVPFLHSIQLPSRCIPGPSRQWEDDGHRSASRW